MSESRRCRVGIENFLSTPPSAVRRLRAGIDAGAVDVVLPGRRGQRLGPYRLISELGRGGMGVVYLAERADGQYRQRVAIKIVGCGPYASAQLAARFHTERQILARLEHPNIARLLDGGSDADGHPYLVMEYVAGEPIDRYCERRRLSLNDRLRLFRTVCAAVHYAHQNLIVHRDLKPSNILVLDGGTPKLLDFGIAKLLEPEALAATAPLTATGAAPMTPEFAAPEQLSGGPITTATDVYTLGLILYQLLARRLPYRFDSAGANNLAAIVREVCDSEVLPPSRVAAPRHRSAALRGDLDNIVLRALAKEPTCRYPSAQALAEDLERYLYGRPVSASRATWRYRAGKFFRRHRLGVGLTGVAVAALLLALTAAVWQWLNAQAEYRRAEQRFAEVRELTNAMVFELPAIIENLSQSTALSKRLLDRGLRYLDRLARERRDDPELARELAAAYYRLATVQGNPMQPNLGDSAGALSNYRKSLALRERLLAQAAGDVNLAIDISDTYRNMSAVHGFGGELGPARRLAERCVTVLRAPASASVDSGKKARQRLGACHLVAAHWANAEGDYDGARRHLRQARPLLPQPPTSPPARRQRGRWLEELAAAAAGSGDLIAALRYERERLELTLAGTATNNKQDQRRRADAYHAYAARLSAVGRAEQALAAYRQAERIWRARAETDDNDISPAQSLAGLYAELGNLYLSNAGRAKTVVDWTVQRQRACDYFERSREQLRRLPKPETAAVGLAARPANLGARYPWLRAAAASLRRGAERCRS